MRALRSGAATVTAVVAAWLLPQPTEHLSENAEADARLRTSKT
jgi:hypothetical protein